MTPSEVKGGVTSSDFIPYQIPIKVTVQLWTKSDTIATPEKFEQLPNFQQLSHIIAQLFQISDMFITRGQQGRRDKAYSTHNTVYT